MSKPIRQRMIQPARDRAYATAHMCKATAAVTADQIVAVTGSTKALKEVQPADANGGRLLNCSSLLIADYAVGLNETASGFVEWKMLQDVNTAGSNPGDYVFLSDTAGGWSLSPGTVPVVVGMVTTSHATTGAVLLDPKRFMQAAAGAGGGPLLFKKRIQTADIEVGLTTKDITVMAVPAGSLVLSAYIEVVTVFDNGTGDVGVDIGFGSGGAELFVKAANNVSSGTGLKAGASVAAQAGASVVPGSGSVNIVARFTSSAGNLNASVTTAGDMYVYLLVARADHAITV